MARKPPRWLVPGDTVSIHIEKIGTFTNPVTDDPLH
jgi:2-keto-4-pentenoate hydratase/2-oxohepta-3-ene-1,7-dioic acid hydratase in catechol pathway